MPDIFDEVDEDLRAERARRLARRYGPYAIALVGLIVLGVAGAQVWRDRRTSARLAVAETYVAAVQGTEGATGEAAKAAADKLAGVADTTSGGYRTLARLQEASARAAAGDAAGARTAWDRVANDGEADPLLRDAARLRLVLAEVDTGDPDAVMRRLEPLLAPTNPFRPLADEARGLLLVRLGKGAEAMDTFKRLMADKTLPRTLQQRASGMFARLVTQGVDPRGTAPAPAAAPVAENPAP